MKLTVKLDYACRVLAQLARRHGNGDVSRIEDLANAEAIPAKYLAQILSELRNGGLVESRRGKQGGYLLAQAPEAITLRDVIGLIEGSLFLGASDASGESGPAVAEAWNRLQGKFEESAAAITLKELAERPAEEMYYI
jgi:Rrf2 family cysteine metabolism transcriptional repressor